MLKHSSSYLSKLQIRFLLANHQIRFQSKVNLKASVHRTMASKVIVITGANQGIGFETARKIVRNGDFHVIITARNEERGQAAIEKLRKETPTASLELMTLDLDNDESQEAFVATLTKKHHNIFCLVNNAGFGVKDPNLAQGEATFKTNFFQTVKLTERMTPLLEKTEGARLISVGSGLAPELFKNLDRQLQERLISPEFRPNDAVLIANEYMEAARAGKLEEMKFPKIELSYPMSKLCLHQYLRAVAKEHPKLLVATCCPGWCSTSMGGEVAPRSPEVGAEVVEYVVVNDLEGKSGEFWEECKMSPSLKIPEE